MSYRSKNPTRKQSLTMALLRVDAAAQELVDLEKPPFGFKIACGVAIECGATWEQIAALTPYTAIDLEDFLDGTV